MILAKLFHDWMQILVIDFIPYVTLWVRGLYKHSELLNLVGWVCKVLHFWKKLSNDWGSFPLRKSCTKRQFSISTISLILRERKSTRYLADYNHTEH